MSLKQILLVFLVFPLIAFPQSVSNKAALEVYNIGNMVYLEGYYNAGDGGGGFFYKTTGSITSDNGTIIGKSDSFKWIRVKDGGFVNVKWFGAKGDGSTDDSKSINNALYYANENKLKLYIPSGRYNLGGGSIDCNVISSSLEVFGDGKSSIITGGSVGNSLIKIPKDNINISKICIDSDKIVSGIHINNGAKNITLNEITFSGKLMSGILLWACTEVRITNCFFNALNGYQILQNEGYSSDNILVTSNLSQNCSNDFVELNSEKSNYSKNWTITNNIVRNIGGVSEGSTGESRFIGITNTDGVIISNNIFDTCFGDSAFHFEGLTGNIIISNNTIRNPNSNYTQAGLLIYNVAPGDSTANPNINNKDRSIIFENNIVELSKEFVPNSTSRELIYSSTIDNTSFQILNNKFINNSTYKDINVIGKSESKKLWNIKNNEFFNFNKVIIIGKNSGSTNIIDNLFNFCDSGILIGGSSTYDNSISINGNTFKNVVKVLETDWEPKINLLSFQNNTIDNSNLSFRFSADFLNTFKYNTFINGATTNYNDKVIKLNIEKGVSTNIFPLDWNEYNMLCWIDIENSTANRVRQLVRVSRNIVSPGIYNNHIQVIDQTRNGNWPTPVYSLIDGKGLNANITGANGGTFNVKISIIDINGFLKDSKQSIGYNNTRVAINESENKITLTANTQFDDIIIYPNPVNDYFHINSEISYTKFDVTDLNGKLIVSFSKNISDTYNLSFLEKGIYLITIFATNNKITQKIIKN